MLIAGVSFAIMNQGTAMLKTNIEALLDEEGGIPVDHCYSEGHWPTGKYWVFDCQSTIGSGMIYPCPSSTTLMRPGNSSLCYAN